MTARENNRIRGSRHWQHKGAGGGKGYRDTEEHRRDSFADRDARDDWNKDTDKRDVTHHLREEEREGRQREDEDHPLSSPVGEEITNRANQSRLAKPRGEGESTTKEQKDVPG